MPNYQASLGRIVKSADLKTKGRISHAVLTFPSPDYDNDYVNPIGGEWVDQPYVNWEHQIPIGVGEVFLKSLPIDGVIQELPIGKTQFFQKSSDLKDVSLAKFDLDTGKRIGYYTEREVLDAADDTWRLVNDDIATGVSIEFSPPGPLGDGWRENGNKSLINKRESYTFDRFIGLGWAHTCNPINPSARTLEGGSWEKAIRIIETGKFPGGKHISPLVMKSLELFKKTRPIIVPSGFKLEKSMKNDLEEYFADDEQSQDGANDDTGSDDNVDIQNEDENDLSPTPTEFAKHMQALEDLATDLEGMLESKNLEHEAGKARLGKHVEDLRDLVRELQSDAHEMFPEAGLGSPYADDEVDDDEEDDDMTEDEDMDAEDDEEGEGEDVEEDADDEEEDDDETEGDDDIGEELEEGLEATEEEGQEEEAEDEKEEEKEEDKLPIKKSKKGKIITKGYPSGIPVKRFKFSDIQEPKKVVKSVSKAKKQSKKPISASVVKELSREFSELAKEIGGLKKTLVQHS